MPLHIVQRGNNRQRTFFDGADRRAYLRFLKQGASERGVAIHAYVLMTNHVHLLATPSDAAGVPQLMHGIGTRYVQRFNRRHERTGSLWEGRYRATVVETDRYFFACMRYIELNPVRAGLCPNPGDYPWSSYRFNADLGTSSWLSPHQVYRALGDSAIACTQAYRALFEDQ